MCGKMMFLFIWVNYLNVQLTTVDIRIDRLIPWKQLKKYHTFTIPPNRQHNLFLMQFSYRCIK